ncbi:MAG: hypothetical protein KDK70_03875 [Myxococcales bacterium]|nr:hypothetical protein [Myxococcales bacterium]
MSALLSAVDSDARADLDLFFAWRAGDRDAGLELVQRHHDAIYRFFDSKVRGDVQGLVTRTFRACLGVRHGLDGIERFRTLLFGAACTELHAHLEQVRRAELTVPADPSSLSLEELGGSPVTHGYEGEGVLARALSRFPLESQLLLELLLGEGLSLRELSYVMSQPLPQLVEHVSTASERLEAELLALGANEDLRARVGAALGERQEQARA